jgi:hypothetical protein
MTALGVLDATFDFARLNEMIENNFLNQVEISINPSCASSVSGLSVDSNEAVSTPRAPGAGCGHVRSNSI